MRGHKRGFPLVFAFPVLVGFYPPHFLGTLGLVVAGTLGWQNAGADKMRLRGRRIQPETSHRWQTSSMIEVGNGLQ